MLPPLTIIKATTNQPQPFWEERGIFHDLYRRISGTYRVHFPCLLQSRYPKCNDQRSEDTEQEAQREISLEYLTDEKHYPLGTTDEYFQAPSRTRNTYLPFAAIRSFSAAVYLRKPCHGWTNGERK